MCIDVSLSIWEKSYVIVGGLIELIYPEKLLLRDVDLTDWLKFWGF